MKTIYIIVAIILGAALYALNSTKPGAGDKPVRGAGPIMQTFMITKLRQSGN